MEPGKKSIPRTEIQRGSEAAMGELTHGAMEDHFLS